MPYIKQSDRDNLNKLVLEFQDKLNCNPGELNYLITQLCLTYLSKKITSAGTEANCYADYNDVVGALESAKLELYRRPIASYEQEKIKQNGDVY